MPHRPGPGSLIGAPQWEALPTQVPLPSCTHFAGVGPALWSEVSAHSCSLFLYLSQLLSPVNSWHISSSFLRGPKLAPFAILIVQEHSFLQWSHQYYLLLILIYSKRTVLRKENIRIPCKCRISQRVLQELVRGPWSTQDQTNHSHQG